MSTDKNLAYALYLELRKYGSTAQIIVMPPIYNPVTDAQEPARMLTRQISAANPRRSWRFYSSKVRSETMPTGSLEIATSVTTPILDELMPYFKGFSVGGWEAYKNPVTVGISFEDLDEVAKSSTPSAFMRRLNKVRVEAGYDEKLFSEI